MGWRRKNSMMAAGTKLGAEAADVPIATRKVLVPCSVSRL